MDNQYTPGPWTAGGTKPYKGNECYIFDGSDPEKLIAYLGWVSPFHKPSIKETIANAHLIASAPELFEAIQHALTIKDLWQPPTDGNGNPEHYGEYAALQHMYFLFDKAINKALNK